MKPYATIPLRLALGLVFIYHGFQKVFGLGVTGFSDILASLGVPLAGLLASIVAYGELVCGILIILGILVRVSSLFLMLIMAVALLKVHLSYGFSIMAGGYEYNLVVILLCLSLVISGSGKLSLANRLGKLKDF